jgi:hypothetical protein
MRRKVCVLLKLMGRNARHVVRRVVGAVHSLVVVLRVHYRTMRRFCLEAIESCEPALKSSRQICGTIEELALECWRPSTRRVRTQRAQERGGLTVSCCSSCWNRLSWATMNFSKSRDLSMPSDEVKS